MRCRATMRTGRGMKLDLCAIEPIGSGMRRHSARHTTSDQTAARRKLDRCGDNLCGDRFHKGAQDFFNLTLAILPPQ